MTVIFHPDFPKDIRKFTSGYEEISHGLALRFRKEVEVAIAEIKLSPQRAGHFLNLGSAIIPEFRRRNLIAFPHFILYASVGEMLIFGSIIPSKPDPLTWLKRFDH